MTDYRKQQKVNTERAVVVEPPSGEKVHAKIVSISLYGAGIYHTVDCDAGTPLVLNFKLPAKGKQVDVSVNSIVRSSHFKGDGHIIGVEFQNLDKEVEALISLYIKYKTKEKEHIRL